MKTVINPLVMSYFQFVIAFCVIGCSVRSEVIEQDPSGLISQLPSTEVKFIVAKRRPFEFLINTSGKIEALKEVQLQFKVDGILSQVNVKNGDKVISGQLLATVDNHRYQLDLRRAEIQLREKQITYEDQIIGYEVAAKEKQKVIYENIRFSSGLAIAENAYDQAKYTFDNSFLKAPISGVVSGLFLKEGSTTKIGDVACTIHKPDELLVSCEILESDAFLIANGQTALIQPLFEREKNYQSKVVAINPRVDVKTGLVNIKLLIDHPAKLFPGMNVSVVIKIPTKNSIVVPKEAVVVRSGKQLVFTEVNGLAKWNYVTVGRENGLEVEITDGLKENSRVIVSNNLQLANDTPVKSWSVPQYDGHSAK
jgi:membrane fusion protein (multidrug efflux system)